MKKPRRGEQIETPVRRNGWSMIILISGLILFVMVLVYFVRAGSPDEDKLKNVASTLPAQRPANSDRLCASSAVYDLIKQQIFRRAAALRGNDQAAFERLAEAAVVRMENPVMESQDRSTGAVNCSGSLSLDLPPGVAVVGGRRTLMADVDYSVSLAADGGRPVVLLRNADAMVTPLATLAQVDQPGEETPLAAPTNQAEPGPVSQPVQSQPEASDQRLPPANPANTVPSADCSAARSRSDVAICNDPDLAALDRQAAAQYSKAIAIASPEQRALLRSTARRFEAYRDQCQTSSCIDDATKGRIREIRDIIEDRWQPPR